MANDSGAARSNYFHVRDIDAFRRDLAAASEELGIWVHGEGSDPAFVAVYSEEPDTGCWPSGHHDERDEWVELDLVALIAPHVIDGDVVVLMETGWQKLRYLFGHAVAFSHAGETRELNLNGIYELGRELGPNVTYAEY
jgi:hypothetical protein